MSDTPKTRHARIKNALNLAEKEGHIYSWGKQSAMPGAMWTVEGRGWVRCYTTLEIEAFIVGLQAASSRG